MFIKIPNYHINIKDWIEEEKSRPFIILNTKYIVSVNPLIVSYDKERKAYYIEITATNGKTFQFGFLNKETVDEYIDLIQTNKQMEIE